MTFYRNHHVVVKLKSLYEKSPQHFGLSTGVAQEISDHVGKKWKSDWLILSSEKYSWFTIDRIYWKRIQTAIEVSDDPKVWLETENSILTVKENKILLSDTEWLNNNIMDVTQQLICKALGRLESYQSVLNWQKSETPFSILARSTFNLCSTVQTFSLCNLARGQA